MRAELNEFGFSPIQIGPRYEILCAHSMKQKQTQFNLISIGK